MARLLLLVLGLTTLAHAASPATQPATQPARELSVVRSLAELREQPVIDLQGGGRIRIGIETTKAAPHGGVLVYCLAEGDYRPANTDRMDENTRECGPVLVRSRQAGPRDVAWILREKQEQLKRLGGELFVAVAEIGDRRTPVEVLLPSGEVMATVDVATDGQVHHDWLGWSERQGEYERIEPTDDETPRTFRVTNDAAEPVWPTFESAVLRDGVQLAADKEREGAPLPRLATLEPDPKLKLSMRGMTLTLRADDRLHVNDPREEILTRWWINGEPCQDRGGLRTPHDLIDGQEMLKRRIDAKEVRLELRFDANRLGAKKGDRIKLQLLHSPSGWEPVRRGQFVLSRLRAAHAEPIEAPRMSNAVEFTVE